MFFKVHSEIPVNGNFRAQFPVEIRTLLILDLAIFYELFWVQSEIPLDGNFRSQFAVLVRTLPQS